MSRVSAANILMMNFNILTEMNFNTSKAVHYLNA